VGIVSIRRIEFEDFGIVDQVAKEPADRRQSSLAGGLVVCLAKESCDVVPFDPIDWLGANDLLKLLEIVTIGFDGVVRAIRFHQATAIFSACKFETGMCGDRREATNCSAKHTPVHNCEQVELGWTRVNDRLFELENLGAAGWWLIALVNCDPVATAKS
jgi:hypothetical protein